MRREHHLFLGFVLGLISALLLWIGDAHLTHRDWGTGAAVFGAGLAVTLFCVRELRRGGIVR